MVGIIETVELVMTRKPERTEIYSMSVFRYDYETGRTTTAHYWRNPFCKAQRDWTVSESTDFDIKAQHFFPSLTRKLTLHV